MAENTQSNNDRGQTVQRKRSLSLKLLGSVTDLFVLLILAWLFSIVVEWIGMMFFWTELGDEHSYQMLMTELGYLNASFSHEFMGSKPVALAIWLSSSIHYWLFEWSRVIDLVEWLTMPPTDASAAHITAASILETVNKYFQSAMNSTQLFGVRLAVAILCTPAFIMIGMAALVDGLVERELRRYGGGNESSFVYHNVKSWMRPVVVGAWFLYLGMPVSVHPNLIFIPAAIMYGGAIYLTTSTFKKYL